MIFQIPIQPLNSYLMATASSMSPVISVDVLSRNSLHRVAQHLVTPQTRSEAADVPSPRNQHELK